MQVKGQRGTRKPVQGRLATQGDRKKIRQQLPVSCASAGGLGIPCKPHITPSSITMLYACMGIRLCITSLIMFGHCQSCN